MYKLSKLLRLGTNESLKDIRLAQSTLKFQGTPQPGETELDLNRGTPSQTTVNTERWSLDTTIKALADKLNDLQMQPSLPITTLIVRA